MNYQTFIYDFILLIIYLPSGYSFIDKILTEIINTSKGPVRGEIVKTVQSSIEYSAFRAIPYAKPPIGQLRFQPPVEADNWKEVLNATTEATPCPQLNSTDKSFRNDSNENCLYLNVYSPKTQFNKSNDELLAVMVWIYGGGFYERDINSNRYGPDFLIEDNVIIVDMNYRVGALGFLSLNHHNATGNMGLKDQVLALKWVQKNIKNFGGDSNRVCCFGQSAGGAAVLYHLISNASRGLFNTSIAMSGSPLNLWSISSSDEAVARAFKIGKELGITESSTKEELFEKLNSSTAEQLVHASQIFVGLDLLLKPTIENPIIAKDAFITECAIKRLKNKNFTQQPVMLGFVQYEQLQLGDELSKIGISLAQIFNSTQMIKSIVNITQLAIMMEKKFDENNVYTLINAISDYTFVAGIDKTQQLLTDGSTAPVYYYRNSFDYDMSYHKVEKRSNLSGTAHSDDIYHIFWLTNGNQSLNISSDISRHRKRMVRLWTNFAKYFDPTPNGTQDNLLNVSWINSGKEGASLEIGQNHLTMKPRPVSDFVKILQKLAIDFQEKLNNCI